MKVADNSREFSVFDGLADFADGCEMRGTTQNSCRAEWAGGTGKDALAFARHGDVSHVADAERILEKLDTEIDSDGVRPVWMPSVVGNFPLVPAYLAGTPEAMLARTDVPDARCEIEVWADATVSGSCDQRDMVRRGVVTMAFAMALSRARNVRMVVYTTNGVGDVAIRLASPMDVSEVCAAFCQPSITRQLIYAWSFSFGWSGTWARWAEVKAGRDVERTTLEKLAGMPKDAVHLSTEKLGEYSSVSDDDLVKILNGKLREVAGK